MTIFLHYLKLGLSRFTGQCSVAALAGFGSEQLVYDPDGLLAVRSLPLNGNFDPSKIYQESGVIAWQGQNRSEPKSLRLFVLPPANSDSFDLLTLWLELSSDLMFNSYKVSLVARPAVRLAIEQLIHFAPIVLSRYVSQQNPSIPKEYPLLAALDALCRVSRTVEEGHAPKGKFLFVTDGTTIDVVLADPVSLRDSKHCGKLLALTKSAGYLVSDGSSVIGANNADLFSFLSAQFRRGGASVYSSGKGLCQIVAGEYRCWQKSFAEVIQTIASENESLRDTAVLAGSIAQSAMDGGYGCTLVLDPAEVPIELAGHRLEKSIPRDNLFDLVSGMASTDGAIQIDAEGGVRAFGCLLDGPTLGAAEVRSRGARYNSALRFSAKEGNQNLCIVIISADGPMTVFYKGQERYSDPWARPVALIEPPGQLFAGVPLSEFDGKQSSSTSEAN